MLSRADATRHDVVEGRASDARERPESIHDGSEDLVAQVAEKGGRTLNDRMRRKPGEDVLTSLRRNARDFVAFLVENPAHARIILWDMARQGTSGSRGRATSNLQIRDRMRTAFEAASASGEIQPVRVETYLQFIYIGTAAAVTWTHYPLEGESKFLSQEETTGKPNRSKNLTASIAPPSEFSATDVERLQDEVENLVIHLLSLDSPG